MIKINSALFEKLKGILRRKGKSKLIEETMKRADAILAQVFGSSLEFIDKVDSKRIRVQDHLKNGLNDDRKLLERYPDFQLILLISNNYRASNGDPFEFLRKLRAMRQWIVRYRGELMGYVLEQLGKSGKEFTSDKAQDEFIVLLNLYRFVMENPEKEKVEGYIKTPPHRAEIRASLDSMRDKKASARIENIIVMLTGQEIEWLARDLREVESWKTRESMTMGIPFFEARAKVFFDGEGKDHLGLIKDFNDEAVEKFSRTNRAKRHLENFYAFLGYLKAQIDAFQRDSFNWEGFTNPKKVVDKLVNDFGAAEFAEELEQKIAYHKGLFSKAEAKREYPREMLQFLTQKLAEFSSVQYMRARVIYPFITAMEILFRSRIAELSKMEKPEVGELKDALLPIVKSERDTAAAILKEARRVKERLRKRIEDLKTMFEYLSDRCADVSTDFFSAKERVIDHDIREQIVSRLEIALARINMAIPLIDRVRKISGASLEATSLTPKYFLAIMYGLGQAAGFAKSAEYNLSLMESIFKDENIQRKLEELKDYMVAVEEEYRVLDRFMKNNFGFLILDNQQTKTSIEIKREENYGRPRAA
ncbi:hypothetical protein HYX06_05515 [Candidatus Woesearchaeota archaeon]|nr:hypothetical protein [Candidatus Woesearchaeota archaeon]